MTALTEREASTCVALAAWVRSQLEAAAPGDLARAVEHTDWYRAGCRLVRAVQAAPEPRPEMSRAVDRADGRSIHVKTPLTAREWELLSKIVDRVGALLSEADAGDDLGDRVTQWHVEGLALLREATERKAP